ncbi:MAG: hypothetical protein VCD00_10030, partial [Candidatus Hydrogenedentota bacterium]
DVYLQEIGEQIPTDSPIQQVTTFNNTVYALKEGGVYKIEKDTLVPFIDSNPPVTFIKGFDNLGDRSGLYYHTQNGTLNQHDGKKRVSSILVHEVADICAHNDQLYYATRDEIIEYAQDGDRRNIKPRDGWLSTDTTLLMADGTQLIADPIRIGPIKKIASYSETLYLMRDRGLALIDDKTFVSNPVDWGTLPSRDLRDMVSIGNSLYTATDRGVSQLRGMALTTLDGSVGLPYEDATTLAKGSGTDLWIGTSRGAIRKVGDDYHYFNGKMWLPDDHVNDITVLGDSVYIATNAGLGIIRYEPYTLRKKSDYYQGQIDAWGVKRLGTVHKLWWYDGDQEWYREISDNDGGHSAHYLAAMSFKYAVTQDPADRAEALEVFKGMIWLDDITPKDGFIARSIWSIPAGKGSRGTRGSGGLPAKWYETEDGNWLWKGDTSSDEVNAHYYSLALFHDLVANPAEKKRAAKHLGNIASHIIDNGWVLRDMDGQPTRWGQWSPEYLLTPYGAESAGLNGMEAQMYVTTAHALTGDQKFADGLQQLLDWGYHKYTVRQKHTFPPESVVPWDDELAFRALHPLITYTKDPALRSIYLRSLERHWEVMRMQKVPFFNFVYGALTGNDCEVAQATQSLRESPLDSTTHTYQNSHRADLHTEPGYTPYMGGTKAISPRNHVSGWGGHSAMQLDGGNNARGITPPVSWLEDYWMGRYYGMIKPPTTKDKNHLTILEETEFGSRAKPYDGPPRPDVMH